MKFLYLSAILFIIGCTAEETKTVDYYMANKTERELKITDCKNNPGELMQTPNCKNAVAAARREVNRSNLNKKKIEQWMDSY